MRGCCLTNLIVLGVTEDPDVEPPVLSDYCAYWGNIASSIFFPCGDGSDVNGNVSQIDLCGSNGFDILDFQEPGNVFRYVNADAAFAYSQMIVPAGNGVPVDMGYYAFDIFGNPSGPQPIVITDSNCFINCFTATFEVNDVAVNSFTQFKYNGVTRDMTGDLPFSNPGHDAWVLTQLIGWLEPSATYVSSFVGNTVTITITTIMTMEEGWWGDGIVTIDQFNFTSC